MSNCSRCTRVHSGICGIPSYSTMKHPGLVRREQDGGYSGFNTNIRAKQKIVKSVPILTQIALESARTELREAITKINKTDADDPTYEVLFSNMERWLDRVAVLQLDL